MHRLYSNYISDEKCNICSYTNTQLQRDQLWHSSTVKTTHMRTQTLLPDLFSDKKHC